MISDQRPAMKQVQSGLLIAGKLVAAFCIAATFMAGCALVRTTGTPSQVALGWLLVIASIVVMASTVSFWAAGFFGFLAYGALRCLGGTLFAGRQNMSGLYMLTFTVSLFAMSILCTRFASARRRIIRIDRAGLVIAATCVLLAFLLGDSYKGVVVLNIGNIALLSAWWAVRKSPRTHHSTRTTASLS